MSSLFGQSLALGRANLSTLGRRPWMSLAMVVSIALVVAVLLGFLAMAGGFRRALEGAGSDDVAIGLGPGATTELASRIEPAQLHLIEEAPGLLHGADGRALVSAELTVPVDAVRRSTGRPATVSLRGVGALGLAVRPGLAIVEGRAPAPGAAEILVGRRIAADYAGFEPGGIVAFGSSRWQVVGVFEAGGSALESEILADASAVQALFGRPNLIQSLRLRLAGPAALGEVQAYSARQPQLGLTLVSERRYLADQSARTARMILLLGWPLALTMAVGATVGALNTLYASVSDRTAEIATVRAIGFARLAAFLGTWIEALALTLAGTAAGVLGSWLVLDGWKASTVGANGAQVAFTLGLSPGDVAEAAGLALVIGAIGGALPALRAARLPLRLAMTR
ncbi:ABC transporter permease [Labrys wisconsinensis]|uniref:ABC transport system permease protein n=1 Tax=Labrys wisconsinensis TaxID=425677 RepID=A0ABU0JCN5_9HYPH|nr:FtsX-like permease family protein [Labrys wisconsinensis]MDQ0471148.1 putative ABC transport system permease protein [Labrys wisconsinensis]